MNRARMDAFSDGVFAIAATLLVLDLRVPALLHPSSGGLWRALLDLWPQYLSYMTSFLVIGIYWMNHHAVFHYVRIIDRGLMWRNLLFLMVVAFIPFPTAVMGRYGDLPAAVLFYGLTLFASSALVNVFWQRLVRGGYLDPELVTPEALRTATRRYALGAVIYVIALGVAFWAPRVSVLLYFALAVYYLFPGGLEQNVIRPTDT